MAKGASADAPLGRGICMNEESKNAIPYSGQIIGAIVEALEIKDEVLTNRTAKVKAT